MDAIKVMNKEHENITKLLKIVRKMSYKILKYEEIDFNDFDLVISFIKNYADKFHHKKEEDFLFNKMVENLGEVAVKVINHGMLVEHEMGRLYLHDLQNALEDLKNGDDEKRLDVIASLISYSHLLERHIDKEDRVIYTFAQRELDEKILESVNVETAKFEEINKEIKEKYLNILNLLEEKYL